MPNVDEYQGWSNRETWCVNLHITNDQFKLNTLSLILSTEGRTVHEKAQRLHDISERWIDDTLDLANLANSSIRDMLNATMVRVNWKEIIEHHINN